MQGGTTPSSKYTQSEEASLRDASSGSACERSEHALPIQSFSQWLQELARKRPVIRTREEMFIYIMTHQVVGRSDLEAIEHCPGDLTDTCRLLVAMRLRHICIYVEHASMNLEDLVGVCSDCLFRRNFLALFSE